MLSAFCFYSIIMMATASVSGPPKENGNDNLGTKAQYSYDWQK